MRIEFVVYGMPAPQGSKRHVGGGRMVESSKAVKPWREAVKYAALQALADAGHPPPLDGPLRAWIVFTLSKPGSAPKRTRTWPCRKPDLDKLLRSTLDALTDAGVIADDARIVEIARLAKSYPDEAVGALRVPGALIVVENMGA